MKKKKGERRTEGLRQGDDQMTALAAVADPEIEQLKADDLVTVFLGKEQFAPRDYRNHPQVQFLTADSASLDFGRLREQVSEHCRVIITTEGVPQNLFHQITGYAKETKRPYVHRRHPNAVAVQLAKYFPEGKSATVKQLDEQGDPIPERGRVQRLFERHNLDLSKPTTEEARRLFELAKQDGTPTTLNSLVSGISARRRKLGRGEIPGSVQKRNPVLDITTELEDMQIRLGLMVEWVRDTASENVRLKTQLADVHRVLGVLAPTS